MRTRPRGGTKGIGIEVPRRKPNLAEFYLESSRFRHARKRIEACLGWLILVSRPVRQALALTTLESICRTFHIGKADVGTIIIAEIKFRLGSASSGLR